MKKLLTAVTLFALSLGLAAPTLAATDNDLIQARVKAMQDAASNHHPEVYLQADRYNTDVQSVMDLNGITREAAIARIARALIAQNGFMPKPPIPADYHPSYNPAPHAFQQFGQSFYAGIDANGAHVFTPEQRSELLDSFWYCSPGLTYTYQGSVSVCK